MKVKNFMKKAIAFCLGLAMTAGVGLGVAGNRASEVDADDEVAAYTLTPAKGSNNSYTGNCDITVDGITWNLTGNSTMLPWRLGGKNLSNEGRELYSKTPIEDEISKVVVTYGSKTCTVNSVSLIYSTNDDFSNSTTLEGTFTASGSYAYSASFGSKCYYKFVFNVTCGGSNQYVEFAKAEFYASGDTPTKTLESIEVSGAPTKTTYSVGDAFDPAGLTVTGTYDDESTAPITDGIDWSIDPETFTSTSETSVDVVASVGDIHSDSYTVTGLTVSEAVSYKLVTSTDDLVVGSKYIIGSSISDGSAYFISTANNSSNRKTTTGDVDSETVNLTDSMMILELGGSADAWTFYTTNYLGTKGYFTTSTSGTSNNLNVAKYTEGNSDFEISFSEKVATIHAKAGNRTYLRYNYNNGSPIFSCYEKASSQSNAYLFREVSTAKTASLSSQNLVGMITSPVTTDTSVTLNTQNMPNVKASDVTVEYKDAGEETFNSFSNNVSVLVGSFNNQVSIISVTFISAGSTDVKFTVADAVSDPVVLHVLTYNEPDSIEVAGGPEFEIETLNDSEASKKSISPDVVIKDSDGNQIVGQEVSWSRELKLIGDTNEKCITISDNDRVKTIYGNNLGLEGSVKITYTAIINNVVYSDVTTEINVKACLDYVDHEVTATFKENLTADQGDTLNPSLVFDSTEGKTHFGKITSVPLNTFMYSYTDDRETATNEFKFSTTQSTIYVFHENDEEYSDSFEITVTPKTVLVERIDINGLTRDDTTGKYLVNVNRGKSYNIAGVAWPENNTENLPINYNMPQGYKGDCTLQGNVFTASNLIGESVEITLSHNGENKASSKLVITISREEQRITVNEPLSWELVEEDLEDWEGDYLVATSVDDNNKIKVADFSSFGSTSDSIGYNEISVSDGVPQNVDLNDVIHVESSTTEGKYKVSANGYYIGRDSNSNGFDKSAVTQEYKTTLDNSISYDNTKSLIKGNGGRCLTFFANNDNFRYYSNSNNSLQLYKKIGGPASIVITDGLFNAVMDANNILGFIDADPNTLACPSNWSAILACFSDVDETIKSSAQYGTEELNEVEQFFRAYDVLVAKYNLADSFERGIEKTKYTITWKVEGQQDVVQSDKLYGDKLVAPTVVAPKGYEFTGWSPAISSDSIVTGSQTYVAQFKQLTALHVYYQTNGGGSITDHNDYYPGDVVTLARGGEKPGYDFNYWTLNGEQYKDSTYTMGETDVTFVAFYTAKEYSITYVNEFGGACGNPATYTIESDDITLKNPEYQPGYMFLGWYNGDNQVSQIKKGSIGDITLTAKWESFEGSEVTTEANFKATSKDGHVVKIDSTSLRICINVRKGVLASLNGYDFRIKVTLLGDNKQEAYLSSYIVRENGLYKTFDATMVIPKDMRDQKILVQLEATNGDNKFLTEGETVSYNEAAQSLDQSKLSALQLEALKMILGE